MTQRPFGLGSAAAAPAVGLSPYKSQVDLYLEMTGETPLANDDDAEALQLEMGRVLEPLILDRFCRRTQFSISHRQHKFVDAKNPWRWITADAVSEDKALVEAKSVGYADPDEWGDELDDNAVPMVVYIQCQHGLACNRQFRHAWVPIIVLNRQFRIYRVTRDAETSALLTKGERAFLDLVESRTPPAPVSVEDARRLWPKHIDGKRIIATPEIVSRVKEHLRWKATVKEAERTKDELALAIQEFMSDCAELVWEHKIGKRLVAEPICTWRQAKPSLVFDEDAFAAKHPKLYRKFRKERAGSRRLLTKEEPFNRENEYANRTTAAETAAA